jgi:hypothetical protein
MAVQLKFFRPEHGYDEIHTERDGNDSEDEVFHKIKVFRSRERKAKTP